MKKFTILTIFPEAFQSYFGISLVKRGLAKKFIGIKTVNLRDFTSDPHKTVDDRPYGGGAGMVLRVDIIDKALKKLRRKGKRQLVVLLTPQGRPFTQKVAEKLARYDELVLVCGRYEGFDERVRKLVDLELSMGDFVLTGGEIPAMAVVDAVSRLVPGFLGKAESLHEESFAGGRLEYPQYTRPPVYAAKSGKAAGKKLAVPKVLLTGNHGMIKQWREREAHKRTAKRRPDLLKD